MKIRTWSSNGIADAEIYRFDDVIRDELITELEVKGLGGKGVEKFITSLETAVSVYFSGLKIKGDSSPSSVRRNIKKTLEQAEKLNEAINKLDFNSMLLIREVEDDGVKMLRERLKAIVKVLQEAGGKANEYPQKGKLVEDERTYLASDIGVAIQKDLGEKITTTRGGLFDTCVSIVLGEVTGKAVKDIHTLIEKAIKIPRN